MTNVIKLPVRIPKKYIRYLKFKASPVRPSSFTEGISAPMIRFLFENGLIDAPPRNPRSMMPDHWRDWHITDKGRAVLRSLES